MIELIKKTMFAGIGLAMMTKDKAEEMARDMAKSADLSAERGQQFVDEVVDRAESARKDLQDTIHRVVNEKLAKTNLATRDDVTQLANRVDELERRLKKSQD